VPLIIKDEPLIGTQTVLKDKGLVQNRVFEKGLAEIFRIGPMFCSDGQKI
jgi:hypothetical protein